MWCIWFVLLEDEGLIVCDGDGVMVFIGFIDFVMEVVLCDGIVYCGVVDEVVVMVLNVD